VVYEDEFVIVIDKPTGILTASMPNDNLDSVFRAIKVYARQKAKRRGTQIWIVHRLDKEASGLLVFAKTAEAFEWLKEQFRSKHINRIYSAVVEGLVEGTDAPKAGAGKSLASGTIQSFLVEDDDGMVRSARGGAPRSRAGGTTGETGDSEERKTGEPKLAVTHYRVIATGQDRSFLQVRLETGRKNQIRVHMKEMGHPIIGDRRYGSKQDPIERVCLHASELAFGHPTNGQTLRFTSPPPEQFWKLLGTSASASGSAGAGEFPAPSFSAAAAPYSSPTTAPEVRARRDDPKRPATKPDSRYTPPQTDDSPISPTTQPFGDSSWDHVADWYNHLIEDRGSDHHKKIIIPGTLRLLDAKPGEKVMDLACGQGNLCRALGSLGIASVGVDSSPKLVENASRIRVHGGEQPQYLVGDARSLPSLKIGPFDHVTCIMALMNIDPLSPVFAGVASSLKVGGHFVAVMLHPAFRAPGQTSWGWDDGRSTANSPTAPTPKRDGPPKTRPGQRMTQFRRVDGYLSPAQRSILMNPGAASTGKTAVTTWTYHRPLQQYVKLLSEAGFAIDGLEEWPSLRASEPGPLAAEENRSRREIPMFLAFRALRVR